MSDKTGENLNIRLPFPLENRLRNIANREGWSIAYTIARYVALGFHFEESYRSFSHAQYCEEHKANQ